MCHGLSRSSHVAETLAEACAWPAPLMADLRALRYLERLHWATDAGPLHARLRVVQNSRVSQLLNAYDGVVADDPMCPSCWPLPPR
ncbi:hypothetical protein MRX96_052027 [Rhipicephalus microplus]